MSPWLLRTASWMFVLVTVGVPLGYFVARLDSRPFLDNAFGEWLATVIGVTAGVPLGLEVNRRLQRAQELNEARRDAAEAKRSRVTLLAHIEYELRENRDQVGSLQLAVKASPKSRTDVWDWAEKIVESFAYDVYDQVAASHSFTISDLDEITLAYAELRTLQNYVRQANAAHSFYHGYSGDITPADAMPEKVFWKTAVVLQRIETAERTRAELAARETTV